MLNELTKITCIGIKVFYATLLLVLFNLTIEAQNWEHYYPTNFYSIYSSSIIQTYDGGYIMSVNNNGGQRTRLNKLDRDGNLIWSKVIFCPTNYEDVFDLCETSDGGIIVVGRSKCNDPSYASFIMRLNSCGERLWLKEFAVDNDFDYMYRVIPLQDGNFLAGARYLGIQTSSSNRVQLIKFDINGSVIWSHDYTHFDGHDFENIIEFADSSLYITGCAYVADPSQVNPVKIRAHLVKIDNDGVELWQNAYGVADYVYSSSINTIQISDSLLMSLSTYEHPNWTLKYWNYLIKTDTSGQEIWKKFVSDTNDLSEYPISLIKLSDSTALILCNVSYSYNFNTIYDYSLKAIKIDFDGNVLDSVQFGTGNNEGIRAILNDEGNVIVCGMHVFGSQSGSFAIKIRPDLQIDTLFNQPWTYDSLCLFPILSDTILYDTTTVSLNEPLFYDSDYKLYPNPTSGEFNLDYIVNINENVYLEIYDFMGKFMEKFPLHSSEKVHSFSISSYHSGLYLIKLVQNEKHLNTFQVCLIAE